MFTSPAAGADALRPAFVQCALWLGRRNDELLTDDKAVRILKPVRQQDRLLGDPEAGGDDGERVPFANSVALTHGRGWAPHRCGPSCRGDDDEFVGGSGRPRGRRGADAAGREDEHGHADQSRSPPGEFWHPRSASGRPSEAEVGRCHARHVGPGIALLATVPQRRDLPPHFPQQLAVEFGGDDCLGIGCRR